MDWYNNLHKPAWTPAPATIGLIWTLLYPVIIITFGFVFIQAARAKIPWKVAIPFALNLASNLLFTPIFSGMKNLPLATFDILIVWGSLLWCIIAIWRHYKWVAIAQIPYFIWVTTATILQISITVMNWGRP
jgi:translocator protein